ncbi:MAG TPA: galactokinase family protein [Ktedonobacteraceae bacterium]|nr:galactokinase family protein [Ktedonobacteraceae bacterium]
MWRFEQPFSETQADVDHFLAVLNEHCDFFDPDIPLWLARAPGRLDLMGGIADYSGSLVLELPLGIATWAAIQPTQDRSVTLLSTGIEEGSGEPLVSLPLDSLKVDDEFSDYSTVHALLTADAKRAWVAYVAGVLVILQRERNFSLDQGLRIFIHSDVPAGKGVSSSAALEVATMQAVNALYDLQLEGRELAILCQQVENLIVGAPCGVMDQMTSACGEQDGLLALLCQPAELQDTIALPEGIEVWGIDSGIRHAVTGADYGSVRVGAFMGYRIIADLVGFDVRPHSGNLVDINDSLWHGYLANISPSLWETKFRNLMPEKLDGATFLAQYLGSTDVVTRINPELTYAVRQPTAHPIYEHHRVRLFRALLAQGSVSEEQLTMLGELMYQSHASYSACGLGSAGTDRLVELVRMAGPAAQLYGAKITGGGCGGTVAVLARRGAWDSIERIATQYSEETGLPVVILSGSSPGALAWGSRRLVADPNLV